VAMLPSVMIEVGEEGLATKILKLMDVLDDHDDVDRIFSNADIPDEVMEKVVS